MDAIHMELAQIAKTVTGIVGVCAQHIESQNRVAYNAEVNFPMASAFKLPLAVYLLALVDQGVFSINQLIEVYPTDISPGSGLIKSLVFHRGLNLSIANLLELTLVVSDNTASDVLLRLVGGPLMVTKFLRDHGISSIRLDRFAKQLVADRFDLSELATADDWSLEQFSTSFYQMTPQELSTAATTFSNDKRDTMSPAAMTTLLVKLAEGELLPPENQILLLEVMQRCQTGEGALKGMLPPETRVAHKTGTLAEVVANDVGIITLPDNAGQLAITVCVKSPDAQSNPASACQRVIAHSARAIYDYYRFTINTTP